MAKMQVQVEVEKETYELGQALANLVVSIKEKSEGGLTAGEIAVAITENIQSLMTGLAGAEQIGAEAQESPEAFANAASLMGTKILGAVVKKAPAPVAAPSA